MKKELKNKLRKKMLAIRENQDAVEAKIKSFQIQKNLLSSEEFKNAKTIMLYASIKNEVQTSYLIEEALKNKKRVVLPVTDTKNNKLLLSELQNIKHLHAGAFDIPEPKKEFVKLVKEKEIDLIVVPGVAFNKDGCRVGYGKGYYDKLLAKLKDVKKVGLAFELQLTNNTFKEEHDVPLDKIITEERIIEC